MLRISCLVTRLPLLSSVAHRNGRRAKIRIVNILLTGATGMLGSAVLLECLDDPQVTAVRVLSRRPLDRTHAKLTEFISGDFGDLAGLGAAFSGVDAVFHCMGASAVGMSEADYTHVTYELTAALVDMARRYAPRCTFVYVSGAGTDNTESGGVMWARVKGRTENLVLGAGLGDAYAFRPGLVLPERGVRSSTAWYNAIYRLMRPFHPVLRHFDAVLSSTDFGRAMINTVHHPKQKKVLGNRDIAALGRLGTGGLGRARYTP